jgi:plasmid stabilization system protein ParE
VLRLVVRPLAEADLDSAFVWYEAQSPSLGLDFLRAVDACFDAIAARPLVYPVVHRGLRRALLRRFPYGVYFHVDETTVRVVACIHCRQHPRRWRRRA